MFLCVVQMGTEPFLCASAAHRETLTATSRRICTAVMSTIIVMSLYCCVKSPQKEGQRYGNKCDDSFTTEGGVTACVFMIVNSVSQVT